MNRRGSGLLLHITSLPSSFGVGDMGPWAYRFADFLYDTGQDVWQILPLNPTEVVHDNSPYHSYSAFAGNTILISPELMVQDGLIEEQDLKPVPDLPQERVDYQKVTDYKKKLFDTAYQNFRSREEQIGQYEYRKFCDEHSSWLEDFALFAALKKHYNKTWNQWPEGIRDRNSKSLESVREQLQEEINKEKFLQYVFFSQWFSLKRYCNQRDIHILGDLPIYVTYDSSDVWSHQEIFKLDEDKLPVYGAGVPPDYFSETGQLWGNPVYRWDILQERNYDWWMQRIGHNLNLFDYVRIDHFRGFIAYWEVPAGEETAINGKWVKAPAEDFFHKLAKKFPFLPIVAEDLGTITPDVREVMRKYEFPGMKVLLFAFGEDNPRNPYLPHNHERNYIVYTGTHDNNTARGWYDYEAGQKDIERLSKYVGKDVSKEEVHWDLIRLALMSVANTAVIPVQDILGLGEETRMNRPAGGTGNWQWRLTPEQFEQIPGDKFKQMLWLYGRK